MAKLDHPAGEACTERTGHAPDLLTTGDMARLTGSTLRTVRFYEESGLLEAAARSQGGHRMFGAAALTKLKLILDLRGAGLSVHSIRDLFMLKATCEDAEDASRRMAEILENQIDAMQRKISKLRHLREEFATTVSIVRECGQCEHRSFPLGCPDCEVLKREDLPRAVKLLWT